MGIKAWRTWRLDRQERKILKTKLRQLEQLIMSCERMFDYLQTALHTVPLEVILHGGTHQQAVDTQDRWGALAVRTAKLTYMLRVMSAEASTITRFWELYTPLGRELHEIRAEAREIALKINLPRYA
ncbi:MAG: hypothetical protein ABIP74_04815 [Candidatus Saccharimonas sp.]